MFWGTYWYYMWLAFYAVICYLLFISYTSIYLSSISPTVFLAEWCKPLTFIGVLGVQKRVLLWLCSDKLKHHYGVIYFRLDPDFISHFSIFDLIQFSLQVELINLYRIFDVWYVCRFYSYFTFHLLIRREIERLIIITTNKIK